MNPADMYSVSDFIALMNETLGLLAVTITGEISECKRWSSGHIYFTLKDKETGFTLPCTIWSRDYAYSSVQLEVGMEIAATGKASFYGPHGKLSFNAKSVELVGEGALKKAYEQLKKKLTQEGLFADAKKRAVPLFPQRIGIITSLHGAVIHDFQNNLGKFGFTLKVLNAKVEGPESGRELALSVRAMRTEDIDVLVIIRGGGSIQSLAGFDNEMLVREIAEFPVPVLAGVGHHQDVTLAALAADAAESTPSLVATLINRSWEQAATSLARSEEKIMFGFADALEHTGRVVQVSFETVSDSLESIFKTYQRATAAVGKAVVAMEYEFKRAKARMGQDGAAILKSFQLSAERTKLHYCTAIPKRLYALYNNRLQGVVRTLDATARVIHANSPERQLKFGYSIVYSKGKVVRSVRDIKAGEALDLQVSDGTIETRVEAIK